MEVEELDKRIYEIHGLVSSTSEKIHGMESRLSEHIGWAEKHTFAEDAQKTALQEKMADVDKRLDKIEWKVGAAMAIIFFAIEHIGWIIEHFKTAVAIAAGK